MLNLRDMVIEKSRKKKKRKKNRRMATTKGKFDKEQKGVVKGRGAIRKHLSR